MTDDSVAVTLKLRWAFGFALIIFFIGIRTLCLNVMRGYVRGYGDHSHLTRPKEEGKDERRELLDEGGLESAGADHVCYNGKA